MENNHFNDWSPLVIRDNFYLRNAATKILFKPADGSYFREMRDGALVSVESESESDTPLPSSPWKPVQIAKKNYLRHQVTKVLFDSTEQRYFEQNKNGNLVLASNQTVNASLYNPSSVHAFMNVLAAIKAFKGGSWIPVPNSDWLFYSEENVYHDSKTGAYFRLESDGTVTGIDPDTTSLTSLRGITNVNPNWKPVPNSDWLFYSEEKVYYEPKTAAFFRLSDTGVVTLVDPEFDNLVPLPSSQPEDVSISSQEIDNISTDTAVNMNTLTSNKPMRADELAGAPQSPRQAPKLTLEAHSPLASGTSRWT